MEINPVSPKETSEEYPLLTHRIQSTFIDTFVIAMLMFVFASWPDRYELVQ